MKLLDNFNEIARNILKVYIATSNFVFVFRLMAGRGVVGWLTINYRAEYNMWGTAFLSF